MWGQGKNKREEKNPDEQIAMHVSGNSILWNTLLSVFKFWAGISAHSGAMVSDAVHSATDVFSTVIVIIGVKAAGRASDEKHPYGHERMECVASLLLAVLLFITGGGIGWSAIGKIAGSTGSGILTPGLPAVFAALVSIAVKEGMYWYTRHGAKKTDSSALMADAWHHRSDALSSVGSLAGILGARMGFPVLDPLAGAIICIFILKAAAAIFRDAIGKMTDEACEGSLILQMKQVVTAEEGVLRLDELKTRRFGSRIYVDIEISADGKLSLEEAHAIAERVHLRVEGRFPKVKHCMVHVNPFERQQGRQSSFCDSGLK